MNTDISSGVVVQYSPSFGYVLVYFFLYRRTLNSDRPLLTFPTNSWTDVMLTGNLFMFHSEMLHVYMLSTSQLVWWSLWTSCGWSHTNYGATCSPSSISLFSVSAAPWVGASVGVSSRQRWLVEWRRRLSDIFCIWNFWIVRINLGCENLLFHHVCPLYVYVWLPWLRFFRAFSSVVRQMPG
jgi:hypothetical protein